MNTLTKSISQLAVISLTFSALISTPSVASDIDTWRDNIAKHKWYAGQQDCTKASLEINKDVFETVKVNSNTYILRQSKCSHFEAPFLYLLLGEKRALLVDTGAKAETGQFAPYQVVNQLVEQYKAENNISDYQLVVSHSHTHSDHYGGDEQFANQPNVQLIEPNHDAVQAFFNFNDTQNAKSQLNLGNRLLSVIHIPGHQAESIAIYDPQTQWLLTGDTVYPGRIYIRNWREFKQSIARLVEFTSEHPVSAVMGTHIEMSNSAGKDYPMGATFQPDETPLPLSVDDLKSLNQSLIKLGDTPTKKVLEKVIIYPVGEPSLVQRALAWLLG